MSLEFRKPVVDKYLFYLFYLKLIKQKGLQGLGSERLPDNHIKTHGFIPGKKKNKAIQV